MSDEPGHRSPKVADEGLRLLLRLVLLAGLILIVFPHLPGVRFSGSALVAVMLAVPFAVMYRLGHSSVRVSSVERKGGWVMTKSSSMEKWTAGRGGWFVVAVVFAVWGTGFLIVPSLLLRLFAVVPSTHMEFRGWWSTLLPAVLFFLVHVLAVSVASGRLDDQFSS